jgi:hypothetical protein
LDDEYTVLTIDQTRQVLSTLIYAWFPEGERPSLLGVVFKHRRWKKRSESTNYLRWEASYTDISSLLISQRGPDKPLLSGDSALS